MQPAMHKRLEFSTIIYLNLRKFRQIIMKDHL
jgi:hypothetical protein